MTTVMNAVLNSYELAWALLHSLWLGAFLATALWWILRHVPAERAQMRYALSIAALVLLLVGAMTAWAILAHAPSTMSPVQSATGGVSNNVARAPAAAASPAPVQVDEASVRTVAPVTSTAWQVRWEAIVAVIWIAGVAFMLLRLAVLLGLTRTMRRQTLACEDEAMLSLLHEAQRSIGIAQRVALRLHRTLMSPAVVGIVRPVILLPLSAATGLSAEQLRIVFMHELAHIRRYDQLVQIGQMFIEALLFFNPAAWWISRVIYQEREACADALAAKQQGAPSQYVQALAAWATLASSVQARSAAAMSVGFAKYSLLDRARRLLEPTYKPSLRLPWRQTLVVVLLGSLAICGLWKGTASAVELAANILSPQERTEKLVDAEKRYGPVVLPAASQGSQETRISGQAIAADGSEVSRVDLSTYSVSGNNSIFSSVRAGQNGQFDGDVRSGTFWIATSAKGFAPSWIGPLRAEPGGHLEGLKIVMERGYEARVRFVGDDEKPVEGVKLTMNLKIASWQTRGGDFTSNSDGVASLKHLVDAEYSVSAERDGYEPSSKNALRIKKGETLAWQLQKAQPLTGVIVDPASKPLSKATIRLFSTEGYMTYGPSGKVLATTDDQGQFTLTSLQRNATHVLYIEHPKVGRMLVRDVQVSKDPLRIVLQPLTVRGRIVGDMAKLKPNRSGQLEVSYGMNVTYANSGNYGMGLGTVPVEVRDGVGHFELTRLPQGKLTVTAGSSTERLKLADEPVQEIVIDLDKPQLATRIVILRLLPPEGQPKPSGTVILQSSYDDAAPEIYETVELKQGEASIKAYVGKRFIYRPVRLVGAWLGEGDVKDLPPGEEPVVVEKQTYPAGAVIGRVLDERGSPAPGDVQVHLYVERRPPLPDDEAKRSWLADAEARVSPVDGKFMLTPLPLGGVYRAVTSRGRYYVVSEPITVDAATPLSEIDVRLGKGVTMAAHVLDPAGKPLGNVPVVFSYTLTNAGSGSWSPAAVTDAQGIVRFDDINVGSGTYFGTVETLKDYQPARVELGPLEKAPVVQLQDGNILEGQLIDDATGWPIPDAEVHASPEQQQPGMWFKYVAEGKTDKDGRFRISTVPQRRCSLQVEGANNADARQQYYTPGTGQQIELRVKLPEWSTLKPRKPD